MAGSMANECGVRRSAMPTNGNAGAARAAYGARAGMEIIVLCPADTPEVNVREIAALGARVYRVNGLIDDCGKIVGEGAREGRWFDMSTLKEPYRIEGKKTMGLELAEQLGWELPDVIFYPTGGGTGLIGMWKAFDELEALGFIGSNRPRMVAVRESQGFAIAVPDDEIVAAGDEAATKDGLLLCPEGGATLAAARRALEQGLISRDDRVVLFNCATGLKYPMADKSKSLDRTK